MCKGFPWVCFMDNNGYPSEVCRNHYSMCIPYKWPILICHISKWSPTKQMNTSGPFLYFQHCHLYLFPLLKVFCWEVAPWNLAVLLMLLNKGKPLCLFQTFGMWLCAFANITLFHSVLIFLSFSTPLSFCYCLLSLLLWLEFPTETNGVCS